MHFIINNGTIINNIKYHQFFVLVILEVVLGIDNVIFVSIIMNRLKADADQKRARTIWMITGIISRSLLLMGLAGYYLKRVKLYLPLLVKG